MIPSDPEGSVSANVTITDLGTLGGITSTAAGVNNAGQIVGISVVPCAGCTVKQTPSHAFRWQSGTMTDLGTLGGKSSGANAINGSGWIVGWANPAGNATHAALWKPGTAAVDLGTLGGGTSSIAYGINGNGVIVGRSDVAGSFSQPHAFKWQNGVMTDLGLLPGGDWSVAQAVNNNGLIVGQASSSTGAIHAVIWRNGAIKDLGVLPGGSTTNRFSVAYGVNNLGEVVGSSDVTGGARHVFLWKAGVGMKDLGTPAGSGFAEAYGINDSSQVVGFYRPSLLDRAFSWRKGVFTDLGTLPTGNVARAFAVNLTGVVAGSSNRQSSGSSNHVTHAARWITP